MTIRALERMSLPPPEVRSADGANARALLAASDDRDEGLRRLVRAIGLQTFDGALMEYLRQICTAEHIHVFQVVGSQPKVLVSLSYDGSRSAERLTASYMDGKIWRFDTSIEDARCQSSNNPVVVHIDPNTLAHGRMRDFYRSVGVRERALVCGQSAEGVLAFSVTLCDRRELFSDDERSRLASIVDTTFCVIEKHYETRRRATRLSASFSSLDEIERRLARAPERLCRRELQVGARVLYGMSTLGIGVDLGIGRETVVTHTKRLYRRLSIGCQRELLLWYLSRYSESSAFG